MNTREIAAEYRLTHWARIMRTRQESGLSIREYCKREGFHENIYCYWQRKLREAASEQMTEMQIPGKNTSLASPRFTEVQLVAGAPALPESIVSNALHIEIAGIKITVDGTYPVEKLAGLLRELNKP